MSNALSFSIDVTAATDTSAVVIPKTDGRAVARRWESARTDRLNQAHWETASPAGTPIDVDLAEQLPTLRQRSRHEYQNNPHVEGVVTTHAVDIVGPDGPTLEVQSDNDRYNSRLEARVREWSELCDYTGRSGLAEILQTWVREIWFAGNFTGQQVTRNPNVPGWDFPATLRIHDIDPNRLETPWGMTGDHGIAFGIRQDRDGIPLTYYFSRPTYYGPYRIPTGEFDPVPADMVHHGFIRHEAEQSIGFPLLSSALDTIGQIRDYDQHVLDAADMAASRSEWFVNLNPDGDKFHPVDPTTEDPVGFSVPERRRVTRAAPPGWDVKGGDATHPTAEYVGHRKERMAEIGRAAAMPLMLIRLDSSGHNYSSARFDRENYVRHVQNWQSWLARRHLTRLVRVLARELQLAGDLPRMPVGTVFRWNWTPPSQVDPTKARGEEKLGLANKTLSFADACRRNNLDEDAVLNSWVRTFKKLQSLGLSDEQIAIFMSSWGGKPGSPAAALPNSAKTAAESPRGATGVPNAAR